MNSPKEQATVLSSNVTENAWFYAMRPEWLETDQERQAFQSQYPELVAKHSDCWQSQETKQA